MSCDEFDNVTNENAHLSTEMTALKQQIAALFKTQQPNTASSNLHIEPAPNPPQSATQLQKSIITPEYITLVTQAMQHTQHLTPSDCKWPAQGITDHQEYEALMDHSFSSMTMSHDE